MVYKLFHKKSWHITTHVGKGGISWNKELVNGLHKHITMKRWIHTIYLSFQDNIWDVDLAGIQLISKYHKSVRFLLCIIDANSKYTWVILLKGKKGNIITSVFQKVLDGSGLKQVMGKSRQ